jgi:hypothetical protein
LKNCERKIHTTLQLTVLAFISLLLKRYWTGSKILLWPIINPFPINNLSGLCISAQLYIITFSAIFNL